MSPARQRHIAFNFKTLFRTMEKQAGGRLQRMEWELNQSGVDRGLEAALIQGGQRELATYSLVRLRLACMPVLRDSCADECCDPAELDGIAAWAGTLKGKRKAGTTTLRNVIERNGSRTDQRTAAWATLRYYHCRDDENPAVKQPWPASALAELDNLDMGRFNEYPTAGSIWLRKYQTVQRLARFMTGSDLATLSDSETFAAIDDLDNVGDQTAAMATLFWLQRPVPIVDMYLCQVLNDHGLVPDRVVHTRKVDRSAIRSFLIDEARSVSSERSEWPAWRILSCLYLWCCEVGGVYCDCAADRTGKCPLVEFCLS